jgi:DNA-binding NarL/FixJ family response regulator
MGIRVLLADDQALLRVGFRMVLEAQDDMTVVGEVGDGAEAARLTLELAPDVVVMDVRMPGTDGIEATRRIVEAGSPSQVLILTTFDVDEYVYEGLRAGASGFLLKNARPEELLGGIRSVAAGDAVVAPRVTRRLLDTFAQQRSNRATDAHLKTLTEREREVLVEVAQAFSNAEIAARMGLSEATVKTHVSRILPKLGLRDRVQAVVLAYETGLVRPS